MPTWTQARRLERTLLRIGAGLVLVCLLAGCKRHQPAPVQAIPVHYVLARSAQDAAARTHPAYLAVVRGDRETDLSFKVGGILDRIGFDAATDWVEGAEVKQGDVLAQLRQSDFINATNSAHAEAELNNKQFERSSALLKEGAVSQQEYDSMNARRIASTSALDQKLQDLRESTLRAPFTGTILARLVNSGQTVAAGQTVLRLASLDQMSVEVAVPDRMVGSVEVGQTVRIRIAGIEREYTTNVVSEVGVAAREGGRLFRVVIKIPNDERRIKSGMTAQVYLQEEAALPPRAVLVPLSALVGGPTNGLSVFVVGEDNRARVRPVTTDEIQLSAILVTEGLQPGEKVVTLGASRLHDGAAVDARPASDAIFGGEVR